MTETIDIVIPVFRDAEGLSSTLSSLRKAKAEAESVCVTTIVINDGGDLSVSEICRRFGVSEILIREAKGSYNARNEGIKAGKSSYVGFLDCDVMVSSNWIVNALSCLQMYDYVGGPIQIKILDEDDPSHWYEYFTAFPSKLYLTKHSFLPTANLFVRRSIFRLVGTFDSKLQSGGDVDFGIRVHAGGLEMGLCSSLFALHPARGRKKLLSKVERVARGNEKRRRMEPSTLILLRTFKQILLVLSPRAPEIRFLRFAPTRLLPNVGLVLSLHGVLLKTIVRRIGRLWIRG